MPFIPPPSLQVPSQSLVSYPVQHGAAPEGPRHLPLTIVWNDTAPQYAVSVNLQAAGLTPGQQLSRISTLYVNNSNCLSQITIYFSDSQFLLTVPPLTTGYYPVITSALQATIVLTTYPIIGGSGPIDGDITVVDFLNFFVPPSQTVIQLIEQQINFNVLLATATTGGELLTGRGLLKSIFMQGIYVMLNLAPSVPNFLFELADVNSQFGQRIQLTGWPQEIYFAATTAITPTSFAAAQTMIFANLTDVNMPFSGLEYDMILANPAQAAPLSNVQILLSYLPLSS